ncbi:acetyltransferase/esterase, partial [Halenospora varia]
GQLVTFIPGGNGHGRQYFPLMLYLSEVLPGYTYATYDRRQMSLSQPISPSPKVPGVKRKFSHPQQARDTLAIIQALNFDTSIIFGSSLGGIIAYQLALDHPSAVTSLIIHEAPTFSLLPDASKIYDGFRGMHEDFEDGKDVARAWRRFNKFFIGLGDDKDKKEKEVEGMREVSSPEVENEVNFWENEFLSAFWTPDLRRLRGLAAPKNSRKGSVVIMRGERSGEAFYARACVEQAEVLGMGNGITGPRDGVMMVPGHHQGFEAEVEAFAPVFMDVLSGFE